MCIMLFKIWKLLFKLGDQTSPRILHWTQVSKTQNASFLFASKTLLTYDILSPHHACLQISPRKDIGGFYDVSYMYFSWTTQHREERKEASVNTKKEVSLFFRQIPPSKERKRLRFFLLLLLLTSEYKQQTQQSELNWISSIREILSDNGDRVGVAG